MVNDTWGHIVIPVGGKVCGSLSPEVKWRKGAGGVICMGRRREPTVRALGSDGEPVVV